MWRDDCKVTESEKLFAMERGESESGRGNVERGNGKGRLCETASEERRSSFSEERHCVHSVLLKAFVLLVRQLHLCCSQNVTMVIRLRRMIWVGRVESMGGDLKYMQSFVTKHEGKKL
jgi:hypothetical protein